MVALARAWRSPRAADRSTPALPPIPAPGDFTVDARFVSISGIAVFVGIGGAALALALIRLIGLFTNPFYYQRFSFQFTSPAGSPLGAAAMIVPVIGGLIIGLMARYGS